MNSRERVLKTFRFEPTDRPACDLMEGFVWPQLQEYFKEKYGFVTKEEVVNHLEPDFRWTLMNKDFKWRLNESINIRGSNYGIGRVGAPEGPLANATYDDIMNLEFRNTDYFIPEDYATLRSQYPDKALVFWPGWIPLFWSACDAFGAEEALVKMMCEPETFEAFIRKHHEMAMGILKSGVEKAKGHCDICLLGDDFATQRSMLISPDCWRQYIKPYLAEQVKFVRDNGMFVMFHSCGSVRPVLEDLIEIGINALLVFQTNAEGMDVESISRDFGGRMTFYGGIDIQYLLCYGTVEEVKQEVIRNVRAFEKCGGYIVANSHQGIPEINGDNMQAMFDAVKSLTRK